MNSNPLRLKSKTVFFTALAFLMATSSTVGFAQSANSITTVGCVNRAVQDGSLAGSPGVPPTTPNSAAVLANSNEPTDVFLLNGAEAPHPAGEPGAKA